MKGKYSANISTHNIIGYTRLITCYWFTIEWDNAISCTKDKMKWRQWLQSVENAALQLLQNCLIQLIPHWINASNWSYYKILQQLYNCFFCWTQPLSDIHHHHTKISNMYSFNSGVSYAAGKGKQKSGDLSFSLSLRSSVIKDFSLIIHFWR